jgi:hypothetical protein
MQIDFSDEQNENADSSIRRRLESNSKATSESELQPKKQDLQRTSTESGIQIDLSDTQFENADSSMR